LLLDAVHVAAMGIWAGGLVAFLVAPDRRFRPYAIGAFAVAIGTGVLLALAHLGSPSAVVSTAYGWALLVKAAIVVIALALFSLFRLRGRVTVGAAALILVAAAVLVSLPPPR
jgi:copper transport protein